MINLLNKFVVTSMLMTAINFAVPRQSGAEEQVTGSIHVMPKVTVTGSHIDTLTTTETIDQELLEKLPNSNGNITELLKAIPGVQFSEKANNSRTGGEIRPPEISISGGRTSDNNFIIDGGNNNSLLDPDFTSYHNTDNIPGHSQRIFLLDHLVEDVSVLRANIPARYGSFTGGIVDIRTIDPEPDIKGELSYRTTHSDWGQAYVHPDDQEDYNASVNADDQPNFVKHQSSVTLHLPVQENIGFLVDYSRSESSIPLKEFDKKIVQRRRTENFFLKYLATPRPETEIRLYLAYAPYQGGYNLSKTINSDFSLFGGGHKFGAELKHQTESGELEITFNLQQSENSREAPNNWYSWKVTPSKNWGTSASHEGGYGDLEKQESSLDAGAHYSFNEQKLGSLMQKLSFGAELSYTQATYDRTEDAYQYIARLADGSKSYYPVLPCPPGDDLCVDGEQFMYFRNTRPANEAHASIFDIQTYIEEQLTINRLTVRPGVRIAYENYQKNLTVAPRLAASYDLFGNKSTLVTSGYNRYYDGNLLAHELKSKQAQLVRAYRCEEDPLTNLCATPTNYDPSYDWLEIPRTTFSATRVSDLRTPYSDEFIIGIQQSLLGGQLELIYIDRDYRDQIVTEVLDRDVDGYTYSEFSNAGRRNHEEVNLSWERSWPNHFFAFTVTWQDTKSNSNSYIDSFDVNQLTDDPEELDTQVWYQGQLTDRLNVPINDYNRPYKASLIYTANFPFNLSFSNETILRSRYQVVKKITSGEVTLSDGSTVNVSTLENDYYAQVTKKSALTFDWALSWKSPDWYRNNVEIRLDIFNVFNRKIEIGTETDEYQLGRQYWAGLTYRF